MITVFLVKKMKCPVSSEMINNILTKSASFEKKIRGEVEVVVVGNASMKKLNTEYRGIKKTTDVLSFAWQEEKTMKGTMLGQIYLCYPRLVAQAKEYHVSVKEELTRMLAHGALHLVGYDHIQQKDEKKMFKLQEEIVNSIMNR